MCSDECFPHILRDNPALLFATLKAIPADQEYSLVPYKPPDNLLLSVLPNTLSFLSGNLVQVLADQVYFFFLRLKVQSGIPLRQLMGSVLKKETIPSQLQVHQLSVLTAFQLAASIH